MGDVEVALTRGLPRVLWRRASLSLTFGQILIPHGPFTRLVTPGMDRCMLLSAVPELASNGRLCESDDRIKLSTAVVPVEQVPHILAYRLAVRTREAA
jgi:hypothetical protein